MYSIRTSAQERTRKRVRGTLWLACALALAFPVWLTATYFWLEGTLSAIAALMPVAAYVAWRITAELTDENDIGISRLDHISVYVERHLPDAGVRRVAWRVVRSVVAIGAVA